MARINLTNQEIIEKLRNDPTYRKEFMTNITSFLKTAGINLDEGSLSSAVDGQLKANVSSTVAIITVM